MSYPLLRRLPLGSLDDQVARASMQLCHKIVMQQLYISRINTLKQWVVVSNPSNKSVDMTDFSLTCDACCDVFYFPNRYTLLPGDEVTIWCSPRDLHLDHDNLLLPYLFWTNDDGSLRHEPFFKLQTHANEVLLRDPLLIEVASIRVDRDEKKEFRVLHCKSVHHRTLRSEIDTRFCVGCLAPPEFEKRASRSCPESGKVMLLPPDHGEVYIFSRYWGVVSNKSLVKHFLAVVFVPLVESFRAVLIYIMFCMFKSRNDLGPQLRSKVLTLFLMMLACDVIARRLMLFIKSGLLVTIASFTAVVLDRLAVFVLYLSLQRLYPALAVSLQYMLTFDLGICCVNAAAVHVRFLEARHNWHPVFKQFTRWDHKFRRFLCLCGIGRELLLHWLLLLPFSNHPSSMWKIVGYLLVPLFTVASGADLLRAVATLLHVVEYPIVLVKTKPRCLQPRREGKKNEVYECQEEDDFSEEEPQKEDPPIAFSTPKTLRFRSIHPFS
ncbi:unnamed protein product [Peronospora belbahrii]|uniref:LTD domain-containing protein n=1 Tax=Peronospora belbahrii TaxID=622444 RepID=A0ABN8D7H9_9STRA|nr:unnamed protein product [Peronospora belbahrii]